MGRETSTPDVILNLICFTEESRLPLNFLGKRPVGMNTSVFPQDHTVCVLGTLGFCYKSVLETRFYYCVGIKRNPGWFYTDFKGNSECSWTPPAKLL